MNFHEDFPCTYNSNFHVDSLHQQPKSPGIPPQHLQYFARWDDNSHNWVMCKLVKVLANKGNLL